jgi:hypothetical protein
LALALLGAAPAAPAVAAEPCFDVDPAAIEPVALAASVIVVGEVRDAHPRPEIDPEAFLKGTVSPEAIRFTYGPGERTACLPAALPIGARVLAFVAVGGGVVHWPAGSAVFVLEDGVALRVDGNLPPLTETELIERVRAVTGQFAVPPAAHEEGAGIDWTGTVLPVTVVLLVIFGIGLALMRIWHRIDPS